MDDDLELAAACEEAYQQALKAEFRRYRNWMALHGAVIGAAIVAFTASLVFADGDDPLYFFLAWLACIGCLAVSPRIRISVNVARARCMALLEDQR